MKQLTSGHAPYASRYGSTPSVLYPVREMPELPEVEYAAERLRRAVLGKTIVRVRLFHPSLLRRLPAEQARELERRLIERIERRGKYQLLYLSGGPVLVVHFRMTGDWAIGRLGDPAEPFARAVLEFHDGTRVTLADRRALATLTLRAAGDDPVPSLGPEPFDPSFTAAWLRAALARRCGAIKPALLDQRVVAGVGNIYAAEALWRSRVSPRAIARSLSAERRTRLVQAIRAVLRRAHGARYWTGDGEGEGEAEGAGEGRWRVYDREGEPCPRCRAPIRRIVQADRSTYFCPRCQRR